MSSLAHAIMSRLTRSNKSSHLLLHPTEYAHIPAQSVIPLDVSWHMPNSGRHANIEFKQGRRIPRARFLDLDTVASDHPLGLPHMMPSPRRFAEECGKGGTKPEPSIDCKLTLTYQRNLGFGRIHTWYCKWDAFLNKSES
jgi:hypothetical protein